MCISSLFISSFSLADSGFNVVNVFFFLVLKTPLTHFMHECAVLAVVTLQIPLFTTGLTCLFTQCVISLAHFCSFSCKEQEQLQGALLDPRVSGHSLGRFLVHHPSECGGKRSNMSGANVQEVHLVLFSLGSVFFIPFLRLYGRAFLIQLFPCVVSFLLAVRSFL